MRTLPLPATTSEVDFTVALVGSGAGGASGGAVGPTNPLYVRAASYTPLASTQQIANATLATAQALTVPTGATVALVQNNGTQPCRWRADGSAPTASTGQRIPSGETLTLDIGNAGLVAARFIREADGVTLDISYYA